MRSVIPLMFLSCPLLMATGCNYNYYTPSETADQSVTQDLSQSPSSTHKPPCSVSMPLMPIPRLVGQKGCSSSVSPGTSTSSGSVTFQSIGEEHNIAVCAGVVDFVLSNELHPLIQVTDKVTWSVSLKVDFTAQNPEYSEASVEIWFLDHDHNKIQQLVGESNKNFSRPETIMPNIQSSSPIYYVNIGAYSASGGYDNHGNMQKAGITILNVIATYKYDNGDCE